MVAGRYGKAARRDAEPQPGEASCPPKTAPEQGEYFNFAEGFAGTPWFELNDFCYRAYCHEDNWLYKVARSYVGHNPEYFADGFAAWVYMQTNGSPPNGPDLTNDWVRDGYEPNWQAISSGVEWSLAVTFNP